MKTLTTLAATLLIVTSFSSFAADDKKAEKLNMNYALNTYIDAITHGKLKGLSEVIDKEAKFTTARSEKINTYGKWDMLNYLKTNANIEQNCTTAYQVLESNLTQCIVKVTMKYEAFSNVNFVSLAKTSSGWKITNVSSSFQN